MKFTDKIYIAGHTGMVGSAILRKLINEGYKNIITASSKDLDLRNQMSVNEFFKTHLPDYVFLASAKVGGILANDLYSGDFIYDNLMIETNVIHSAYIHNVKKLLFFGSSCIFPKLSEQPIKEEYLLKGYLESTNQSFAIAKIAGIEMCNAYRKQYNCNFITAMPTNLYGTNDNYHPENSHVFPALIRKITLAKLNNDPSISIWGSGNPKREFMHVDDLADAAVFLIEKYNEKNIINVGWGEDLSIKELALLIASKLNYNGSLIFDTTKPDGTLRKLLDTNKITKLGWKPKISLSEGVEKTIDEFTRLVNIKH
ncbi:GDP-L-fucose synthase [Flavobacteriaceae bacterium]|nr:GDP-L-fucose synthase [Flavobacteriaceae bacterium]